jgi:hypothetical protein
LAPLHKGSVLLGCVDTGEVRLAVRAQDGVAVFQDAQLLKTLGALKRRGRKCKKRTEKRAAVYVQTNVLQGL